MNTMDFSLSVVGIKQTSKETNSPAKLEVEVKEKHLHRFCNLFSR